MRFITLFGRRSSARRRGAMLLWATLVVSLLSVPSAAAQGEEEDPPPPNFLVIVADDLDAVYTPFWSAMPKTAALLRDNGMSFARTFATTPTCCPARANLLTGKYAHNTNVFANFGENGGLSNFQAGGHEAETVAVHLDDAGYQTALIGKYMNEYAQQPDHIPVGWDKWFAFSDNGFYKGYWYGVNDNGTFQLFGQAEEDYSTDVINDELIEFLNDTETNDDDPFFAFVTPTAPHVPLPPAPRHANHAWVGTTRPVTPNYYEVDTSDKPWWLQTALPRRFGWRTYIETTDWEYRMGSLLALDDLIADAMGTLSDNDELSNTYIIFTSDNGYNGGAHGLNDKLVPYEESTRVPLVVFGPGVTPGETNGDLIGLIDIAPTILELAGLPIPADVDGRSIQPLWAESSPTWRSEILFEYKPTIADDTPPDEVWFWAMILDAPGYRAVRSHSHVLIEWWDGEMIFAPDFHEYELYDLINDPWQLDNLLAQPNGLQDNAAILAYLAQRLDELRDCSGATC